MKSTTTREVTLDGAPASPGLAAHINAQRDKAEALGNCPGCCSVFTYSHGPTCTKGLGPKPVGRDGGLPVDVDSLLKILGYRADVAVPSIAAE